MRAREQHLAALAPRRPAAGQLDPRAGARAIDQPRE